jgi:esterase/lipase
MALSFLVADFSYAQNNAVSDSGHLKIKRFNDTYIDAYVKYPATGKKVPLLVMCQGSGYGSMTGPFLGVTEQWKDTIARIVVEKQGVSYGDNGDKLTKTYKENNAVYNRLYDYLRVFEYLRAKANWWNGDVYVIGGSEGGLMAGMIASFYPNVKGVAILGFGGGLNFAEAWPIAKRKQMKAEGLSEINIQKAEKAAKDSLVIARRNSTYTKSYDGEDNTFKWWASIIDLRLANTLLDLDIPIYVADGSEDLMMPALSAQKLNEEFIKQGKTNLVYKEYKGFNHEFADSTGKSHYAEIFIQAIAWMLSNK